MRMRAFLLIVLLLLAGGQAAQAKRLYGVLQGKIPYLATDRQAGVRARTLEIGWDAYEPQAGAWNRAYMEKMRHEYEQDRRAGFAVVLDLGTQYPPGWVKKIQPWRDQYGDMNADAANTAWSLVVRQKMAEYLRRVFHDLGTDFLAVRLGSGAFPETLFPDDAPGHKFCYWAFDADASRSNPVPRWRPGQPSPRGEAARFYAWYVGRLIDTMNWEQRVARACGYRGKLLQLFPGFGVRGNKPDVGLQALLRDNLVPPAGVYGVDGAGRAAVWPLVIAGIRDKRNVVVECSSLGDSSSDPHQFTSLNEQSADPYYWSSSHWIAFLAGKNKLPRWAESVGGTDAANMRQCFDLLTTYGYTALFWAFDPDLHDDKPGHATLSDYRRLIQQNP